MSDLQQELLKINDRGTSRYGAEETKSRINALCESEGIACVITRIDNPVAGLGAVLQIDIEGLSTVTLETQPSDSFKYSAPRNDAKSYAKTLNAERDISWAFDFFESLKAMQEQCYAEAASKGWHPGDAAPNTDAEINEMACRLMCSHEEISELWSAVRGATFRERCDKADKMEAIGLPALTCGEEEFADRFIRLLDEAQTHGIDMRKSVAVKMLYNRSRPHRHGGKKR